MRADLSGVSDLSAASAAGWAAGRPEREKFPYRTGSAWRRRRCRGGFTDVLLFRHHIPEYRRKLGICDRGVDDRRG